MWSDPIADMLTRIRNSARVRKTQAMIPCSKMKVGIAKVLVEEGFISGYDVIGDTKQDMLRIELKYGPRGEQVLHRLDRVSSPGRRVYKKSSELPRVLNGLGIAILSTSQGVLSDRQCRERQIGGELLCTAY
ncbi:MAG: 30S ribosomal protein S8 [Planctomycetes bacterium]|nr:30S ribosomal protein S8 [Planctomycetota bacterium]MCH8879544.1 30S ribosomal protein S8 [Planctomycetota bacterium]MCZ6652924.1 30S ribosomal protein S8 [Planctomycetota bacterium]